MFATITYTPGACISVINKNISGKSSYASASRKICLPAETTLHNPHKSFEWQQNMVGPWTLLFPPFNVCLFFAQLGARLFLSWPSNQMPGGHLALSFPGNVIYERHLAVICKISAAWWLFQLLNGSSPSRREQKVEVLLVNLKPILVV